MEIEKDNFESEMNRGFLQLIIMLILEKPRYGYEMISFLEESGYQVEEATLYPLLRRLEKKNVLISKWEVEESKPRKYYEITDEGRNKRELMIKIWDSQHNIVNKLRGGIL